MDPSDPECEGEKLCPIQTADGAVIDARTPFIVIKLGLIMVSRHPLLSIFTIPIP